MPARNRSRSFRTNECGTYYHYLNSPPKTQTYCVLQGWDEVCDDFTGNFMGANGLNILTSDRAYPFFDGTDYLSPGVVKQQCVHLPAYSMSAESTDPLTYYGTCGAVCQSNAAWEILSGTNPNVPHVSVPTFFGELKDLPSLVKDWGGDLLKKVAKGYLSWRWAVRPMIGDIRKLLNFQKACDRRFDWLKQLRDGKVLRRKCGLGHAEGVTEQVGDSLIHSVGFQVRAKWSDAYFYKKWGSARYKVAPGTQLPKTNDSLRKLAWRLTFGITSHEALATLWELLPWSWFVDWFFHVGDTIAALNNTVPLTWSHLCLMRTLGCRRSFSITSKPAWVTVSGDPFGSKVRKERFVVSPILPFSISLPLVDKGKWSILAALAALRR